MRALLLLLLLGNALLLAARQGWLGPGWGSGGESEREPLRVQRQVNPGLVRVLAPAAASAALTATAASAAEAAAAADRQCLEAGPFNTTEAPVAERALRDAGLADGQWQALAQEVGGTVMLYMGRYAEPGAVQRKLDELARLGIAGDALPAAHPMAPGIDLGHFDSQALAEAALAKLGQSGVRTARVQPLLPPQRIVRLRVPAADAARRATLVALKLPSGPGFVPCTELVAAEAAATASAAASAASAAR